jgi:Domain of Unknown Function (DUF1080)
MNLDSFTASGSPMKQLRRLGTRLLLVVAGGFSILAADAPWIVLFDGSSTAAFRGYKQTGFPTKGWEMTDGTLHVKAGGGAGDLVTREQFKDFELEFQWKVSPGANSGVMYRVSEAFDAPWNTGPEYQVLDDSRHGDGKNPKTSAGALYALVAANSAKALKPVGEWNSARIVLRGSQLEHWLNGQKVVAVDLASPAARELIAQSKFKSLPKFAQEASGYICFQDHGDDVWFRDIRIRKLDQP